MSSNLQNLLVLLGLVCIAGLGYYLYTQKQASTLDIEGGTSVSQANVESAAFLQKLNELKEIELNGQLFSDPRFQSLVNNRQPVIEEPVGRANPFISVDNN